jgi:4-hydroxybenzoyl-CoA reductase subunit beta
MKNFAYFEPEEVGSALTLLAEHRGQAKIMAGGTDLIPQMKRGLIFPAAVVNLSKVPSLKKMEQSQKGLRIGAMVPLSILERSPLLASRYPALQEAVRHVAARPIRNSGTIGGNICLDTKCIFRDQSQTWKRALEPCFKMGGERCYVVPGGKTCHASFAADTVPVLIALQAKVKIVSSSATDPPTLEGGGEGGGGQQVPSMSSSGRERMIPVEELYTGNGLQPLALSQEELLSEIFLPFPPSAAECVYLRFSLCKAMDFPLVSAVIFLERKNGLCSEARIVLGAVAPRPLRLTQLEESLKGEKITESLLHDCSIKAPEEAWQISKSGRMDAFTRKMITHLVYQGLKKTWRA